MKQVFSVLCAPKSQVKIKKRVLIKPFVDTVTLSFPEYLTAKKFVEKCIEFVPQHIAKSFISEYAKRLNKPIDYDSIVPESDKISAENRRLKSANIYLRNASKKVQNVIRRLPFDNKAALNRDEIAEHEARLCAAHCLNIIQALENEAGEYEQKLVNALSQLDQYARRRRVRITVLDLDNIEAVEAAIVRYVNEEWWIAKFSRIRAEAREYINIVQGLVGKGRQEYASNQCVSEYRQQRASNEAYLSLMEVVDQETNERFSLKEIADKTTANPELRRVELMVRCRGLEEFAEDLRYKAFFVTWTAPSKYHRTSKKWNGSTPNETQKYLCGQWAKCRAAIKRAKIDWFGVRVAEPHASATPHWHMLVFTRQSQSSAMQSIMSSYALEHDKDESGALENRFLIEEIDKSKGSATGYIAKYIAKNINASHLKDQTDHDGSGTLEESVLRVCAWASRWRVRQFQFFGSAAVSVYRECRRLKSSVECKALEAVRMAADSGKWSAFTKALALNPVKLVYGVEKQNKYGEKVNAISGLMSINSLFEIITRSKIFKLEKRRNAALSGGSRATWSPVNNCTQSEKLTEKALRKLAQAAGIASEFVFPLLKGAKVIDYGRGFRMCNGQIIEFKP